MRVRFTVICLFRVPAHSPAFRKCGNQEGQGYRRGTVATQGLIEFVRELSRLRTLDDQSLDIAVTTKWTSSR